MEKRKVFLSFLGIGGPHGYNESYYINEETGKISKKVKYIQNAIVEIENNNFDVKYLFCTEEAKNERFIELMEENGRKYEFKTVEIPNGKNENEIWEIFQKIYDVINERDEIVFDVTHSYRFLPMLGLQLLQYAKFLKKITVKKLCYGAYEMRYNKEVSGKEGEIEVSPIMDFTSFSTLQDWSLAGHMFVKTGVIEEFAGLSRKELTGLHKSLNREINNLYNISGDLKVIASNFHTNRGINIVEAYRIEELKEKIISMKKELLPPFTLILEEIEKSISLLKKGNTDNIIQAIQWCIDKELVQQGITMLQEGLVTILLDRIGEEYRDKKLRMNFGDHLGKDMHTGNNKNISEETSEKMKKLVKKIEDIGIDYEGLKICYCNVKNIRNDINHGGFNLDTKNLGNKKPASEIKAEVFKKNLKENFEKIKKILGN